MATSEMFCPHSHVDMEEEGSVCLSNVDEEEDDDHSNYSSYSQFYSATGGSIDGFSYGGGGGGGGGWSSRRASSVSEVSVAVEEVEVKVHLGKVERICRICHLSLVEESDGGEEFGLPIELGCSCKDDLGTAHKNCAETWFKIKGNKICEICNSIARNVVGTNENADATQNSNESANSSGEPSAAPATQEPQRFWQGNRFLNFLLACMIFAFVISWLFHFKVPS